MTEFVNVRMLDDIGQRIFDKIQDKLDPKRFRYDPETGIVTMQTVEDALWLWGRLGYDCPVVIDIVADSPEHDSVLRFLDGLSARDKDCIYLVESSVGCRISIHVNHTRQDLVERIWNAIYPSNTVTGSPRSARALSHEGLGNKLAEKQQQIAFELAKWSMMIVTEDGTLVSDEFLRLIEEEERRKNREGRRVGKTPKGPHNGR